MRKHEVRPLSKVEQKQLERVSRSQTTAYRRVRRAKLILLAAQGERIKDIAQATDCDTETVRRQVKRFNEYGLASLDDKPRSGRKQVYSEVERGQMVASARTQPEQLGQSFGRWTLTRLTEYVNQRLGIAISRAQLGRVLEAEGLRWYQEKTYFTERPDPQFGEKRGRL
jgi:transposase